MCPSSLTLEQIEHELEQMHALPAEAIRKFLAEFSPTAMRLHHATLKRLRALEAEQAERLHERGCERDASALAAAAAPEREATQVPADAWEALASLRSELNAEAFGAPGDRTSLAAAIHQVREGLLDRQAANKNGHSRSRATIGTEQCNGTPATVAGGWWEATHQPTPFSAFCGTTAGLGGLALAEHALGALGARWGIGALGFSSHHDVLIFVGAFGALSALLYGAPSAPLGRPKATLGGFTLVISLSMTLHYANLACGAAQGRGACLSPAFEKVLAPALGIAAMLRWATVHPPAAACAIQYMALAEPQLQGPTFLLAPALLGVAWMLLVQWLVARTLRCTSESDSRPLGWRAHGLRHGSRAMTLL
jgi:hypothetical protein